MPIALCSGFARASTVLRMTLTTVAIALKLTTSRPSGGTIIVALAPRLAWEQIPGLRAMLAGTVVVAHFVFAVGITPLLLFFLLVVSPAPETELHATMEERFPLLAAVVEVGHVEVLVTVHPHVGQLVDPLHFFFFLSWVAQPPAARPWCKGVPTRHPTQRASTTCVRVSNRVASPRRAVPCS